MNSFPFDSEVSGTDALGNPLYDRAVNSDILASLLGRLYSDGIVRDKEGELGFYVTPGQNALQTQATPGYVIIQGRCGEEPEVITFNHDAPHATYSRIDRIVLRMSLESNERRISMYLLKGTPSSKPVAPALTRNASVHEKCVANVNIAPGTSFITQSKITDTRLDSNLCGVSEIPMKVFNTTQLYEQVQADLEELHQAQQAIFDAWFATVESTLGENEAGNLLNLINQRLPLSGGEMTGTIRFRGPVDAETLDAYGGTFGVSASTGNAYFEHTTNGRTDNYVSLTKDEVRLGKPLGIKYGGFGGTTPEQALNAIGACSIELVQKTLPTSWRGNTCILAVEGFNPLLHAAMLVPDSDSFVHFNECGVRISGTTTGTITLVATNNPTQEISVTIWIFRIPAILTPKEANEASE